MIIIPAVHKIADSYYPAIKIGTKVYYFTPRAFFWPADAINKARDLVIELRNSIETSLTTGDVYKLTEE